MSAIRIMSFTATLHLTRNCINMLEKQSRVTTAQMRIRCCKPTSTDVDNLALTEQQQAHENTPQIRPVPTKTASTATDEDAYTTTQNTTKRATKLLGEIHAESEWDVYCDVLPDSSICHHVTPSCPICELEEEPGCEFESVGGGSKKPQRLSYTSWDLLD